MFMKKIFVIIILVCSALTIKAQPGKYAGTMKSLINTVYTDSRSIPALAGWSFSEGSVLNSLNDPEMITVDVFKRGTTVLFSLVSKKILHRRNLELLIYWK